MMQFTYHARDVRGQAVRGQMSAPTMEAVVEHLRIRSLTTVEVQVRKGMMEVLTPLSQASRASSMIVALRTLGTLLAMSLPIRRALEIVIEAVRGRSLREGFRAVLASVENGDALGAAMQRHGDLFSPLTIALVHAGERGGVLAETLERHAHNLDRQYALRQRLLTAMIYPAIVLCTSLGVIIFLIGNVLPMFASLFTQLRVDEPLVLRIALSLGEIATPLNSGAVILSTACLGILLRGKRMNFPIPVLDALREKAVTARFSRALATLLHAGVQLPEALICVRPILEMRRFESAIDGILSALRDGNSLGQAAAAQGVFEPLFLHFVRLGEETGTLDEQLLRLADWFERDFSEATARATALLEPGMILVLGALVGALVFSVFVPLYSLIGGIR
jgi:type IV pilus assembly protein PilC